MSVAEPLISLCHSGAESLLISIGAHAPGPRRVNPTTLSIINASRSLAHLIGASRLVLPRNPIGLGSAVASIVVRVHDLLTRRL
jgi:hypothetical protein